MNILELLPDIDKMFAPKDDGEQEIEPSEEELALQRLSREHMTDYLAIKNAIARTDLADRIVDMAVKAGLKERA